MNNSQFPKVNFSRALVLGVIILTALIAFEMFNYSTTDYALKDLLGNLTFFSMPWSTILAIAFCGIDFAGIARLFTPESGNDEPKEVWYLFGAWFLAATMNAMLTWWGVSMAIVSHKLASTEVIDASTLIKIVPVFIALMVWVIRILIIGTISVAGDGLFKAESRKSYSSRRMNPVEPINPFPVRNPVSSPISPRPLIQRSPLSASPASRVEVPRPEPTYHNVMQ
jgi:hypothetical protein